MHAPGANAKNGYESTLAKKSMANETSELLCETASTKFFKWDIMKNLLLHLS